MSKGLKIGEDAPLFKLESYNAGVINLGELIGSQKIVIIFSRYFGCPICQLDLNELLINVKDIEDKRAKLLYITQSGEEIAKKFINEKKITFPVIHSSKEELYADYGLGIMTAGAFKKVRSKLKEAKEEGIEHGEYEGWEKQGPGQFVIDQSGKVIHAQAGWIDIPSLLDVL